MLFLLVFFAYSVITHSGATLFIDSAQISDEVLQYLSPEVDVQPYDGFFKYLDGLSDGLGLSKDAVSGFIKPSFCQPRLCLCQQVLLGNKASLAVAEAVGEVCATLF